MADLNDIMLKLGQLEAQGRGVKQEVCVIRDDVKELRRALKGTNDNPGLCVRVDRQEQIHKRQMLFLVPALAALAALVIHQLWDIITGQ
ncbi:MAG: hypothetical protein ACE5FM_00060 [Methyloligellaceae bacterium]